MAFLRSSKSRFATEIKVRAERKCGELLAKVERAPGERTDSTSSKPETRFQAAIRENDIPRATAACYQSLASMSEAHFETAVATAKDTAGEVTTAFMLREASLFRRAYAFCYRNDSTAERLPGGKRVCQSAMTIEDGAKRYPGPRRSSRPARCGR